MAAGLVLLVSSCGTSRSEEDALAARGRASLVATFSDTSWRLPPSHSLTCGNERRSSRTTMDTGDSYEDSIFCSLSSKAMAHLLDRLDRGFGTNVTPSQKRCINQKVSRDQVAALLAARMRGADERAAIVATFDHQLASAIRRCSDTKTEPADRRE